MECLFGWDTKKQRGTVGILGIVEAFCQAIEEQGRGSLHGHFLVWIKGFALMRSMIYSKDEAVKNEAKKTYIKYVDQVMSATYGKFPLDMGTPHTCAKCTNEGSIDEIYENRKSVSKGNALQKDNQPLRDACHKIKMHQIDGLVMQCKSCNTLRRPTHVISDSLNNLKDKLKSNVPFPLSPELLDVAAYRFGYDVDADHKVTNKNNHDSFWNDPRARKFC